VKPLAGTSHPKLKLRVVGYRAIFWWMRKGGEACYLDPDFRRKEIPRVGTREVKLHPENRFYLSGTRGGTW
jgi:hypothetical protein